MAWFEKGTFYCINRVLKLFGAYGAFKGEKLVLKVKTAYFEGGKWRGLRRVLFTASTEF